MSSMMAMTAVLPLLLLLLAVPVLVGVYVYRDSRRRGMNAALWTLIAVLAPGLIGFLIYLLVRGDAVEFQCPKCGNPVRESDLVCPRCGARLRITCPQCGTPVQSDWIACPRCGAALTEENTTVTPAVPRKDRSLKKVIAVAIGVPVLLMAVLLIGNLAMASGGGNASMCYISQATFFDDPDTPQHVKTQVKQWLDQDVQDDHAYGLLYSSAFNGEQTHYILLYTPGNSSNTTSWRRSDSLFGTKLHMDFCGGGTGEEVFTMLMADSRRPPKLDIQLDGKKIPCELTPVDFNPTTYCIEPPAEVVSPGVMELPQHFLLTRFTDQQESGETEVTGETLEKLTTDLNEAPYLETNHPVYTYLPGQETEDSFELKLLYGVDTVRHCQLFRWNGGVYVLDMEGPEERSIRQMDEEFYTLCAELCQ